MIRFTQLVQNMITLGNRNASKRLEGLSEPSTKELTSVRLRPETKIYLQAQSECLGISLSQVINMILDGVVSMEIKSPADNRVKQIYDRIMTLFEMHGINIVDMVKMLSSHNIKLSQVRNPEGFIDLVTIEMIKDIAQWFQVDYGWIIGETDRMYSSTELSWYKNAYSFSQVLSAMSYRYNNLKVFVVKRKGVEFDRAESSDNNNDRLDMGFVITYDYDVNDVKFTRYEVCEFQRWNYSKCRGYLKFIFYFLDSLKHRVGSYGVTFDGEVIDGLISGALIPVAVQNNLFESWYPYEKIGDLEGNYDIEQDRHEYKKRIDQLIKLVGSGSPICRIYPETQGFVNGWIIEYIVDNVLNRGFYHDIGSGFSDIANKLVIK